MAQQVSCAPGVVSAALHYRDPRSLSNDTLAPFSNVPIGQFEVAAFHL
jgi:hypothetical protein